MSQKMTLEDAVGAARTIVVDGREWHLTPLSAQGWGEYFAWLRGEYLELTKRHVADLLPEDRARLLDAAFAKAPALTLDSPELAATMNSPGGVFRLIKLHLLPRHPEVTDEDIARMVHSPEVRERALAGVAETVPDESGARPKAPAGTKAQKRRRPRRKK